MTSSYNEKQGKKNKKVLFVSFVVSIFLVIIKSIFGILSGSLSLLSSALDSFMDAISSGINYFIMHHSSKPADKEHPFGHGKFEAFSSLLQSLLIFIGATLLILYSISLLFSYFFSQYIETKTDITFWTFAIVLLSILTPVLLSLYIKKKSNSNISPVMHAEHSHFWADGLLNFGVLISLVSVYFFQLFWIDSVIGICISFFLLQESYSLFFESFNVLTDKELDENITKEIEKILNNSDEIEGWHAMRTRKSGSEYHIDVHLEFSDDISLKKAHNSSHNIENRIMEKYNNAIILTHFDYRNDVNDVNNKK